GRYFSPEVAALLAERGEEEAPGEEREITILFSDLRGFTTLSERLSGPQVVALLNEVDEELVEAIFEHGGTLDKYLGDGIMAYFGAPIGMPDHAERRVRSALAIRPRLRRPHPRAAGQRRPGAPAGCRRSPRNRGPRGRRGEPPTRVPRDRRRGERGRPRAAGHQVGGRSHPRLRRDRPPGRSGDRLRARRHARSPGADRPARKLRARVKSQRGFSRTASRPRHVPQPKKSIQGGSAQVMYCSVRLWSRGLWHDVQQRSWWDRELSNERPVIGADQQEAGGCTRGEESHGDEPSGTLVSVGKSYRDQNTDGLDHEASPFQQAHRRVADEDALAACVESGFKRDRHLTLCDPLARTAGRQRERELYRLDQVARGNLQRGGLTRHHGPLLVRGFFDMGRGSGFPI